jgi:hypothetical protein
VRLSARNRRCSPPHTDQWDPTPRRARKLRDARALRRAPLLAALPKCPITDRRHQGQGGELNSADLERRRESGASETLWLCWRLGRFRRQNFKLRQPSTLAAKPSLREPVRHSFIGLVDSRGHLLRATAVWMVLAHQTIPLPAQLKPRERARSVQPQPRGVLHELRTTITRRRPLRGRGSDPLFAPRRAGSSRKDGARHSFTGSA